jgi:hypothetical protein
MLLIEYLNIGINSKKSASQLRLLIKIEITRRMHLINEMYDDI